jgi:hypothetical protein
MAGGGGFEPPSATPKAAVLPLDDPPGWEAKNDRIRHLGPANFLVIIIFIVKALQAFYAFARPTSVKIGALLSIIFTFTNFYL